MAASNIPGQTFGDLAPSEYPGERLGLPPSGRGSVARFGRRLVALVIDWTIATLVVAGIGAIVPGWQELGANPLSVPLAFALLQILFIATIGGSIGHRVLGIRLVALAGRHIGVWRPILRTILLCLVLPIIVWDSDQRGFHDKIAGTVLIRG